MRLKASGEQTLRCEFLPGGLGALLRVESEQCLDSDVHWNKNVY